MPAEKIRRITITNSIQTVASICASMHLTIPTVGSSLTRRGT